MKSISGTALFVVLVVLAVSIFGALLIFSKTEKLSSIGDCWFSYCYLNRDACMDLPFYNIVYKGNMTDCQKLQQLCNKISNEDPRKIGLFCTWDNSTRTCQCYSILDKIFNKYEYTYKSSNSSTEMLVYYG